MFRIRDQLARVVVTFLLCLIPLFFWGNNFSMHRVVHAEELDAGGPGKLRELINQIEQISGLFVQATYDEGGEQIAVRSGVLRLRKPNDFYLYYDDPSAETILLDENFLYRYHHALNQVALYDASQIPQSSLGLLFDISYLEDNYVLSSPIQAEGENTVRVIASAKNTDNLRNAYQHVEFWFTTSAADVLDTDGLGEIEQIEFVDNFGFSNLLTFSEVSYADIDESNFILNTNESTQIIDMRN